MHVPVSRYKHAQLAMSAKSTYYRWARYRHFAWCTAFHSLLSFQLGEYAKYNHPGQVVRDPSIHVQAICDKELKTEYYSHKNTRVFMVCVLVIPIFATTFLSILIRSLHKEINSELAIERNHGNLAALITVGVSVQCVIIGMDVAAAYYVHTKQYEYSDYELQNTINLIVTFITLAFDSAVGLFMLSCLAYLWCSFFHKDATQQNYYNGKCASCSKGVLEMCFSCCLIPCFYAVFGDIKQKEALAMPRNYGESANPPLQVRVANQRMSWVLFNMLLSPLFSMASHSGYILVAWLTEPSNTTVTALVTIAVVLAASLVFRRCYRVNSEVTLFPTWPFLICCCPIAQFCIHIRNVVKLMCAYCCGKYEADIMQADNAAATQNDIQTAIELDDTYKNELTYLLIARAAKFSKKPFNTQALCIVMSWGILVVGALALIIVSFYEMPFKTLALVNYLLNIFQIFIVVITLLITYKIFILGEPDLQKVIKQIRKTYYKSRVQEDDSHLEDVEATGVIVGKAMEKIIHQ